MNLPKPPNGTPLIMHVRCKQQETVEFGSSYEEEQKVRAINVSGRYA
jgi:hypothetical protein